MKNTSVIKKDREFYRNFGVLIDALKGIAIAQFHALEKKIVHFEEFMQILESFFDPLDMAAIQHPFVDPKDAPLGVVAVTSDAGLLGGLNHRVMIAAGNYMKHPKSRLIVVGRQGQKIALGYKIPCKNFMGIDDEKRYATALEIRDHIVDEVLNKHIGHVKVIYPIAISMKIQQVGQLNLLPSSEWKKNISAAVSPEESGRALKGHQGGGDILLETSPDDLIEYLTTIWLGQKIFDILQLSRLAELAARTIHLEESSQKVKEIDKKLQLQYFRARHEIIDQQMRELFTARSIYA
jgi:ATP synthase F1 gamma subunit